MKQTQYSWLRVKQTALLLLFSFVLIPATMANDDVAILKSMQNGYVKVASEASKAVVNIRVEQIIERSARSANPFEFFGEDLFEHFFRQGPGSPSPRNRQPQPQPKTEKDIRYGQGSGFIISDDGFILTNNHVVGEADKVFVTLVDDREFEAEVIGADKETDVAVLKITTKEPLPVLPLGDSDKIEVGQFAVAVGNPFGLSHTVTSGIISAKGRSNVGITGYDYLIQTDAAINPGNSGGPLVNLDGEAIGMNTAIYSRSGGYMGIGFAIPINLAKAIFTQLKETGTVTRGYIGVYIQDISPQMAKSFDMEGKDGILVAEVEKESPAQEGGLQQGDIILELDGDAVKETASFRNKVALMAPGTKIELSVQRDGKKINVTITLGEKPTSVEETTVSGETVSKSLGFTVQTLTDELAERLGFENESGVLVTEVDESSNAYRSGLRPGMLVREINRQDVNSLKDFKAAAEEATNSGDVLLLVKDTRGTRFIAYKIDQ
jgi:serine protease Do